MIQLNVIHITVPPLRRQGLQKCESVLAALSHDLFRFVCLCPFQRLYAQIRVYMPPSVCTCVYAPASVCVCDLTVTQPAGSGVPS